MLIFKIDLTFDVPYFHSPTIVSIHIIVTFHFIFCVHSLFLSLSRSSLSFTYFSDMISSGKTLKTILFQFCWDNFQYLLFLLKFIFVSNEIIVPLCFLSQDLWFSISFVSISFIYANIFQKKKDQTISTPNSPFWFVHFLFGP